MNKHFEPIRLGTIEHLTLRDVWLSEEKNFTPWLSRNLDYLINAVGIDMECVDTELRAGDGQRHADMLVELQDGNLAVIENQYGKADPSHGWRTLHYARALGAKVAFWIFEDICSDDEKLISFLNEHESINIIGVQATVCRIDGSIPALDFRVIPSSQDALYKVMLKSKSSREATSKEMFYGDFFPTMMAEVHGRNPRLGKGHYSNTRGHWNYYCSWNSSFGSRNPWEAAFSQKRGSSGSYYIHLMLRREKAKENFAYVKSQVDLLTKDVSVDYSLEWDYDNDRKSQKVKFVYPNPVNVDEVTHDEVRKLIDWTCSILPQLELNLSVIRNNRDNPKFKIVENS